MAGPPHCPPGSQHTAPLRRSPARRTAPAHQESGVGIPTAGCGKQKARPDPREGGEHLGHGCSTEQLIPGAPGKPRRQAEHTYMQAQRPPFRRPPYTLPNGRLISCLPPARRNPRVQPRRCRESLASSPGPRAAPPPLNSSNPRTARCEPLPAEGGEREEEDEGGRWSLSAGEARVAPHTREAPGCVQGRPEGRGTGTRVPEAAGGEITWPGEFAAASSSSSCCCSPVSRRSSAPHSDDCGGGSVPGGRAAPRGTMAAPRTPHGADTSRPYRQTAIAPLLARARPPPPIRACACSTSSAAPPHPGPLAVGSARGPFLRYKRAQGNGAERAF
ncbi:basic salivary proline-rich protein 3-like [Melopsittacus undulatus]|uniref:basic salivary proline-rich protein 3-like n=1 Tax=Melopsittacus undulatus TaxID=13146 RepID=UPI00146E03F5|nr:basic salivary proline-rich protein 3-like [Melopsittacus undulatus]